METRSRYHLTGFMKDWKLEVERLEMNAHMNGTYYQRPWLLTVKLTVPDSRSETGVVLDIAHRFPFYEEPSDEEVQDCLRRVAMHEVDEGFICNGKLFMDPHNHPDEHN